MATFVVLRHPVIILVKDFINPYSLTFLNKLKSEKYFNNLFKYCATSRLKVGKRSKKNQKDPKTIKIKNYGSARKEIITFSRTIPV